MCAIFTENAKYLGLIPVYIDVVVRLQWHGHSGVVRRLQQPRTELVVVVHTVQVVDVPEAKQKLKNSLVLSSPAEGIVG